MNFGKSLAKGFLGMGAWGKEIRRREVHVHGELSRAVDWLFVAEHAPPLAPFTRLVGSREIKTEVEVFVGVLDIFGSLSLHITMVQVEDYGRYYTDGDDYTKDDGKDHGVLALGFLASVAIRGRNTVLPRLEPRWRLITNHDTRTQAKNRGTNLD